uniref:methyl-accepting chemotaxis protein n=1 Tax=Collimonas silvisoli TaxID=2825884 RepID=UPI001E59BDFB
MNWFKNRQTATKLLLGFGTMIVLLAITIAIAYNAISTFHDAQQRLFEQEFVGVVGVVELRADLNRQRGRILEFMLTNNRAKQEVLLRDIRSGSAKIDNSLRTLTVLFKENPGFLLKLDEWKSILATYRQTRETEIQLIAANKVDEARTMAENPQAGRFERMRSIAIELEQEMLKHARAHIADSDELATHSIVQFAILGGLALVFGVALTTLLTRLIARPMVAIADLAERMASGDLTVTLATQQRADEVGVLNQNFARMSADLRLQIGEVVHGANVIGLAASDIVASTAQLAANANESAVAVSEATTTVDEVRQTAQLASQKSMQVSDSTQKAAQSAQNGRKSAEDVGAGMNRIRQQMEAIASSMERLSEQSQTIGQ